MNIAAEARRNGRPVVVLPEPSGTLDTITAPELEALELAEPRFACAELIVEGLSFLAGKPKLGKSWLALQLAIAVALGEAWLGHACERGGVLYLALEDSKRRLQSRLRKILGGRDVPTALSFATECQRLDKGGLILISAWLDAHPDALLVIIDTLAKVKPIGKRGGNIYAEDSDAGARLQALAFKHHVAVLVLTHTRKASAEDFLEEVSGTLGLTGAADSVLVLKRDRHAEEGTLSITGRDIEEQVLSLCFTPEDLWVAIGHAADVCLSAERREVLEVLRASNPASGSPAMTPDAIAKALNKKPGTIRKLLKAMKSDGQVKVGMKSGTYIPSSYGGDE
jgi:hypothetical protein